MPLVLHQIDAFTDRAFAGNPAAICLLDRPAPDRWMQALAAEMALSETAYLVAVDGEPATWDLRWFTPTVEVDLCGHATLAAAHALVAEHGSVAGDLRFRTRSGELRARVLAPGRYQLDLPADAASPVEPPPGLLTGLGCDPSAVVAVHRGRTDLLVVLDDASAVLALDPDHTQLRALGTRGVVVTARGGTTPDGRPADCTSRFFAPGSGIDEDPVTGSAHCLVGPYWGEVLGRTDLLAHQASPRGGVLQLGLVEDRVTLTGDAVTVLEATLREVAEPDRP